MLEAGLTPLEGGHSGETFLADTGVERSVVRIYGGRSARRGREAIDIDAAVLRLVHGLLPVPRVREVRRPDPGLDIPAILLTEHLPGARLDLVLADADAALEKRIGAHLGELLSRLNGMPFLTAGPFVDAELRVGSWGPDCADLTTYVEHLRGTGALAEWAEPDFAALVELADHAQDLLDPVERTCLVHSDFNPKNVLVRPESGEVTGLLDWEFAHAGLPVADLGNLIRFDRSPALLDGVLSTFDPPGVDGDPVALARAADMWALLDLASRRTENPVTERAHAQLLAMVRSGDLARVTG